MDGNGRWAKKRGLPRNVGHSRGASVFRSTVEHCAKTGVKTLTVYAFSSENWNRPKEEIAALMNLFRDYLKDSSNYLHKNVRTRFIGDREILDDDIVKLMEKAEESTKDYDLMTLNIAINYGGQNEILNAVKLLLEESEVNGKSSKEVIKEAFEKHLYTYPSNSVDLLIRPSGEHRISNFLLWQLAYAEFVFFDDILWPDFKDSDIDRAIEEFSKRNRRFGAV